MPRKIVTKQLRCYPAAKTEIAEPANVEHVFIETVRVNNRAENSYLAEHTRASHPSGDLLQDVRDFRSGTNAEILVELRSTRGTLRSSDIYYALRSTAYNSMNGWSRGILLLSWPKSLRFSRQRGVSPLLVAP
jgi:hypothetical protein